MKNKENVYVSLRGKSKEELTDLYEFLVGNGEKPLRGFEDFLMYSVSVAENATLAYRQGGYNDWINNHCYGKTEVTIEELKQIIKPSMGKETPQQEIKRLKARIAELENKLPKVGDIGLFYMDDGCKVIDILYCIEYSDKETPYNTKNSCWSNFEPLPTELQEQLKKYLK